MKIRYSALLLIAVPVIFDIGFGVLASKFKYPDILREPTGEVLSLFRIIEGQILPAWWAMFFAALLFIPVAVISLDLLKIKKYRDLALVTGTIAGVVQAIGLSRWIFAVPFIAALAKDPANEAVSHANFALIHTYLGVGIGEFLGYLFTTAWTLLISANLLEANQKPIAILGITSALGIAIGCFEPFGFSAAGPINAISYLAWSIWMIWLGISHLRESTRLDPVH